MKWIAIVAIVVTGFICAGLAFVPGQQDEASIAADAEQKSVELRAEIETKDQQIYNLTVIIIIVTILFSLMVIIVLYYRFRTLKSIDRKIDELTYIDTLTGLMNRRAILELLAIEETRFHRNKREFSIILADIDELSKINEGYGQTCGDSVITRIAELFTAALRKQDNVARWSGEEYLLLLPETDAGGAFKVAESLKRTIADKFLPCGGNDIDVTLSYGVCTFNGKFSLDVCIALADQALIDAKNDGKNCIRQKLGA